jgi:hypothetical protein
MRDGSAAGTVTTNEISTPRWSAITIGHTKHECGSPNT